MNSTIRKLPGSKKEFPFVKSVVDHRRPASSKVQNVPAVHSKSDVQKPRPGKAVSAKGIAGPVSLQNRPAWDPSTKIEPTPVLYIKPLPGTRKTQEDLPNKSFKARPVPISHAKPFRPILPSKILKFTGTQTSNDEFVTGQEKSDNKQVDEATSKPEELTAESPQAPHETIEIPEKAAETPAGSADPGLVSCEEQSVVDPVLPTIKPQENVLIEEIKVKENEVVDEKEQSVDLPEAEAEMPTGAEDPGLMSSVLQSVVDPVLPSPTPENGIPIDETEVNEVTGEKEQVVQLPAAEMPAEAEDPGLFSRMWRSMVDPILGQRKPDNEGTGQTEEVAVKHPESEVPPVTEEPGVPAATETESPAIEEVVIPSVGEKESPVVEESAMPSVEEKKDESPEVAKEVVEDQPMAGPSSDEGAVRKYPPGYGSKKERIRKALEKKGIMPGDELPPKKPFKNQGRKRSKSPSLMEIYENLLKAPPYKESD
ncbi:fibrous sheath CABYR-binding protein-like [Daphnia carinata]|uniref:fibrous sheath CABYR-binding protein-like n=1 Tax=Daphnia carinata TaxID=120202 RepID=UPI00257F9A5A|nr:fibrous sheath CABYR-binding protein-like [Daphnia carinata]